jgi:hypothetical protein
LHGEAILKAGYSFTSASKKGAVLNAMLTADYSAVDLILGKEKQTKMGRGGVTELTFKTFDKDLQNAITEYCKAGGRIFVTGAYVATDLWQNPLSPSQKEDREFATKVLKYKWRDNKAAITGRVRTVVSPLMSERHDYTYYNELNEQSYVVESPDAIEPADTCAYTAFRYTENNLSAGVAFIGSEKDNYRTVVLGFPFESIRGTSERDELMKEILLFFKKESFR